MAADGEDVATGPATPAGRRWWQAPPVLAVAAVVAVTLTVLVVGWRADLPAAVLLAVVGVLLAAEDFASHRLPNAVLQPTAVALVLLLTVAALLDDAWGALLRGVLAALVCGAGYLLLALLRPTGLGLGDVKLGALLGLWLGWLGWPAVVIGVLAGFLLGGLAALALIIVRRADRGSAIAFGPWLLLGAAVATAVPPGVLLPA